MNALTFALEAIRRQPATKPLAWTSGIIINLSPDEYLDITDPASLIPPAHVADAAMRKGR